MLRQNWRLIARIERLADNLLIVLAFFLAYYGRSSLVYWDERWNWGLPFYGDLLFPIKDYFIVLVVALIGFNLSLSMFGAYSSMRLADSFHLLKISTLSSLFTLVLLATTLFLLKIDLSRSFIGLFLLLVALSLSAERFLVLRLLRFWRKRGKNFRNVIICGLGEQSLRLAQEISKKPELGIRVRRFFVLEDLSEAEFETQSAKFRQDLKLNSLTTAIPVMKGLEALENSLKTLAIDEIIFADVIQVMPVVESAITVAWDQGIRTTIAADLFSVGLVKSKLSYFGEMPLIHFETPPGDSWELVVKRGLDILLSSILLVLLSPVFLLIGLVVRLTSEGPVLFRQRRVGLNGRIFTMYKFRSMYSGAEAQLHKLREQNEMKGPVFKLSDDPRITKVGKFLRRFSLDELPQLWNVFLGDMSLVGPRPPVPGEVQEYQRHYRRRLSMRPGLTCTWQVSGRNNIIEFKDWVRLDLEYIDNWSLARDFMLLIRTIPAVIFGAGAR